MHKHFNKTYRRTRKIIDRIIKSTKHSAECIDVVQQNRFNICLTCGTRTKQISSWHEYRDEWQRGSREDFISDHPDYRVSWTKNPYWELEHPDIVNSRITERISRL